MAGWRLSCGLGVGTFLLHIGTCWAAGLNTLEFYNDEIEKIIEIPDATCVCFLDDESNYSVSRMGEKKIKITAAGITERSASLLVDCTSDSIVYSMRYFSRKKYGFDGQAGRRKSLPDAYAAISTSRNAFGEGSSYYEISDRSERYFQVTARQSDFLSASQGLRTHSFDMAHEDSDWRLGYGVDRVYYGSDSKFNYRVVLGLLGMNLSQTQSKQIHTGFEEKSTWLRLPAPFGLGFGHRLASDGTELRVIDRFFSATRNDWSLTALTRYTQEKAQSGEITKKARIRIDQSLGRWGLRPGVSNSIDCEKVTRCFLTEWSLKMPINLMRTSIAPEYGLLPHFAGVNLSTRFGGGQSFNFGMREYFKQKSFANRWRFVVKDDVAAGTSEGSQLHLETSKGDWTYFIDQSASIINKQSIGSGMGFQFTGNRFNTALRFLRPKLDNGPVTALGDFRYFFDKNIRSVTIGLARSKIKVRVLSVAGDNPVSGAKLDILKDGEIVGGLETSAEGEALFLGARCCGEYEVRAKHRDFSAEGTAYVSASLREPSLTLYIVDHRKIPVEFYVRKSNLELERVNIANFYPEIGEAIVSLAGAMYEGGFIYVPISGSVNLVINDGLLPFRYHVLSVDGAIVDTKIDSPKPVRVVLEEKSR